MNGGILRVSGEREEREKREPDANARDAAAQDRAQLLDLSRIVAVACPAMPRVPGIYFLLLAGEVQYVGKTRNGGQRIGAHLHPPLYKCW